MRIAWRLFVACALSLVIYSCAPKWYWRGLGSGDYAYAGLMVAVVWFSCMAPSRISEIPDPGFARVLLLAGAVIAGPTLVYHVFNADSTKKAVANFIMLVGVGLYTQSRLRLMRAARSEA